MHWINTILSKRDALSAGRGERSKASKTSTLPSLVTRGVCVNEDEDKYDDEDD